MSLAWFNMLTCLRLVAWICYTWHLTQFGSWSQANAERERALESVRWPKAFWEASGGHRGCWPPARGSDSNIFRRKSVVYAANRRSETHEAQTQTLNKRCSGSAVCGSSMLAGRINHPDPPVLIDLIISSDWGMLGLLWEFLGRITVNIHWSLILTGWKMINLLQTDQNESSSANKHPSTIGTN